MEEFNKTIFNTAHSLSPIISEENEESNTYKSSSEKKSNIKIRKKEDKRVSFGGRVEFVITPRESQEIAELPTAPKENYQNPCFIEIDTLSCSTEESLTQTIKNFKNGYRETLDCVKSKLGIHSMAPTDIDIENLKADNVSLQRKLRDLEKELENINVQAENEIKQEKIEEKSLQDNLNEFNNNIEASLEGLNKKNEEIKEINKVYSSILNVNVECEGNSFTCQGRKNNAEYIFNIEPFNRGIRYKPIKVDFPSGNLLNCEIHDLMRHELPLLFIRIFRALNPN
ncbi:unnamed protein product [Blepharisma stoltei]|uniref:Kinetochore protein SPC25 n=1 Tax=Blepharisma stoltei TaxID=1481888 RepID=A0AAU9JZ26_9CILI|nr:unnamed protein product [Blepharisma stoltei]